ncbi:MAG: TonB-dependent receptor [Pseudomonadota bacterium]|jgi:iron complex outermembrane receptor protein
MKNTLLRSAVLVTLATTANAQSFNASEVAQSQFPDPVVISASRIPQPRSAGSVVVDVITREQIEQSGASNIVEFLDSVPGMSIKRLYGRLGIDASVDVGYMGEAGSQNVLILVDGQRVNGLDSSGTRFAQVPMSSIERIEVRKASGGALYGDRAQGGVINIITRVDNRKEVNLSAGSFGYRKVDGYLGFKADDINGGLSLMSARSDGYRQHSDARQESAQFRVSHSSDIGRLSLTARGFEETANLPGSLTPAEYAEDPKKISSSYAPRTHRTGNSWGLKYDRAIGDGDLLTVDLLQQTSKDESGGAFYGFYSSSAITNKRSALLPEYRTKVGLAQLLFGGEFSDAQANTDGGKHVSRASESAYVQAIRPIGERWTLDGGLRTQRVQSDFQSSVTAAKTSADDRKSGFSVGVKAQLSETAFVRAGALTGYRFGNADELYLFNRRTFAMLEINPNLRPMTTQEYFLQAERKYDSGKIEAHYRHVKTRDEIAYLRDCGTVGLTDASCNANLYDTNRSIFSLSSEWFLGHGFWVKGSADFVDATISTGSYAGNRLPLTPKEAVRLSAEKRYQDFTLIGSANYRGNLVQASDQAGIKPMIPGRNVIDLGLRTQVSKTMSVSAWIRNLTNKTYYDYASGNGIYPADARGIYVNLKASL